MQARFGSALQNPPSKSATSPLRLFRVQIPISGRQYSCLYHVSRGKTWNIPPCARITDNPASISDSDTSVPSLAFLSIPPRTFFVFQPRIENKQTKNYPCLFLTYFYLISACKYYHSGKGFRPILIHNINLPSLSWLLLTRSIYITHPG